MNTHIKERLMTYLANELRDVERTVIESHLEVCADCRQEYEFLLTLEQALADTPLEDPGPDFTAAVMSQVTRMEVEYTPVPNPPTTFAASFLKQWKTSDFRNMVASVVAAFVLFQGASAILPKIEKYDSAITGYSVVAKVKLELWMSDVTRLLNR